MNAILEYLGLPSSFTSTNMEFLNGNPYAEDLLKTLERAINRGKLSEKEAMLIALSSASNNQHKELTLAFSQKAISAKATKQEISEVVAVTSFMAKNNVLFRFKHLSGNLSYEKLPAGLKMRNKFDSPLGKQFYEIIALVVSSLNACEDCIKLHQQEAIDAGVGEQKLFDAVRLASVIQGLCIALS